MTRAQNRTHAINDERARNEAALHAETDFLAWPRPPSDDDPAPF
jgi:hypothetical protein